MNPYITGASIKALREAGGMTQSQLGDRIGVSSKTVSKWETGKGLPDISLIEPLAKALGVSVMELMQGQQIVNRNTSGNMLRARLYVCPVCGNVLTGMGSAVISCCGITLPPLEGEEPDAEHEIRLERVEDETFVSMIHPMTKSHYIALFAFVTSDRIQFVKLYPEGNAEARMQLRGKGWLYACCNRHGLYRIKIG